jgi:uridine kinase
VSDVADVVAAVERARARRDGTGRAAVGVSGYAGAGKSVLTRRLVEVLDDAVRVRGDEFLVPSRIVRRSADWDGVERERLRAEVLEPFRAGRSVSVRPLDWATGRLGDPTPLPRSPVLVVDLIGLFHPDLLPWLDLTVWVDAEPDVALERGMARDRAAGLDHDELWTNVWSPNDLEFEQMFLPADHADLRVVPPRPG